MVSLLYGVVWSFSCSDTCKISGSGVASGEQHHLHTVRSTEPMVGGKGVAEWVVGSVL